MSFFVELCRFNGKLAILFEVGLCSLVSLSGLSSFVCSESSTYKEKRKFLEQY